MEPVFCLSSGAHVRAAVVLIIGAISVTWLLWCSQGRDPFLPTISETWEHAPGSFFSRWVVGNGCDMLAWAQVYLYFGSQSSERWAPATLRQYIYRFGFPLNSESGRDEPRVEDDRELKRTRTCPVALQNTLDRPNRSGSDRITSQ